MSAVICVQFCLFAATVCVLLIHAKPTGTCPHPQGITWFSHKGQQRYGIFNNTVTDFNTAFNCCHSLGSHVRMSVLKSADVIGLMTYIQKHFGAGAEEVWVDARRSDDGPFVWGVGGDLGEVSSTLWSSGEPHTGEGCARFKVKTRKLFGRPCSARHGVFCQQVSLGTSSIPSLSDHESIFQTTRDSGLSTTLPKTAASQTTKNPNDRVTSSHSLSGSMTSNEPSSSEPFPPGDPASTASVVSTLSLWTSHEEHKFSEHDSSHNAKYVSAVSGSPLFLESSMHTGTTSAGGDPGWTSVSGSVSGGLNTAPFVKSAIKTNRDVGRDVLHSRCSLCCASRVHAFLSHAKETASAAKNRVQATHKGVTLNGTETKSETQELLQNESHSIRTATITNVNVNTDELTILLSSIRSHLTVNVTTLSKTVRKKRSISDQRVSACVIGISCLLPPLFILVMVAVMDLMRYRQWKWN